jgi:tetratricopeptide (TPR) repeat protein
MRSELVALGASLALTSGVVARSLTVPEWARVEVVPVEGVELARASTWEVRVTALVGPLTASPPRVRVSGGGLVRGPRPAEGTRLDAGESFTWTVRARLDRPEAGAALEVELPVTCPREALAEVAREQYRDAPRATLGELQGRIRSMEERPVLTARAAPWLSLEEGHADGVGPRFTHYTTADALGVRFSLWRPARRKGEGAARTALANASPRLRALLEKSGVSQGPDDGSQAYLALLAQLGTSPPAQLGRRAEELAARAAPEVAAASATLSAVAAAQAGRWEVAVQAFERLQDAPGLGHYAAYNLAEALVATGEPERAVAAYRRALRLRPVFTRARRRLRELEGKTP